MRSSAFASWRPRNSGCRRTRPSLHLGAEVGLALFAEGGGPLGRNGVCRGVLAISVPVLAERLYELMGDYETAAPTCCSPGGADLATAKSRSVSEAAVPALTVTRLTVGSPRPLPDA
jgi:hypothetical protein